MVNASTAQEGGWHETELYMWTDYSPIITESGYQVGDYLTIYYNLCAFTPTFHQDIVICQAANDQTPLYLSLFNVGAAHIAAIVFCVFFAIAAVIFVVTFGIIIVIYILENCSCSCNFTLPKINFKRKDIDVTIPVPHIGQQQLEIREVYIDPPRYDSGTQVPVELNQFPQSVPQYSEQYGQSSDQQYGYGKQFGRYDDQYDDQYKKRDFYGGSIETV
jgi:hypothetical protein